MRLPIQNIRNHAYRVGTVLAIVILLVLATSFLVRVYFQATLFDFVVSDWWTFNDEIAHWHQILTFSEAGFDGGYYAVNEVPAQASFSHFGPWGPVFPMIYGSIARLVGWNTYSSVLFNISVIALALSAFVYLAQPDGRQSTTIACLLLTFWPVLLFLPSCMQQSLHQAIAILLAGLFYRLIRTQPGSTRLRLALIATLVAASLVRATWSILFLPYCLLTVRGTSVSAMLRALCVSLVLVGAHFLVWGFLASPGHFANTTLVNSLIHSPWTGVALLVRNVRSNVYRWVSLKSDELVLLHLVLRYQASFLVLLSLVYSLPRRVRKAIRFKARPEPASWFNAANLGMAVALEVLLATVARAGEFFDYRHIAPHLVLSMLVIALASTKRWLVWLIIITNVIALPWFLGTYSQVRAHNFVRDSSSIVSFQTETEGILVFDGTEDPWCNTLAIELDLYRRPLIGVPGGIGISHIFNWADVEMPLKSKYVLLQPGLFEEIVEGPRRGNIHLEPLAETSLGTLYLNLDSECSR